MKLRLAWIQSKILFQIMKPSLTKTEKYTNTRITLKIRGWGKEWEKGRQNILNLKMQYNLGKRVLLTMLAVSNYYNIYVNFFMHLRVIP